MCLRANVAFPLCLIPAADGRREALDGAANALRFTPVLRLHKEDFA
jgi:hypothetical protein